MGSISFIAGLELAALAPHMEGMNASSSSSSYYAEQNVQTAVGAAMIALSIVFVALRFYVRLRFNKAPLGWDDWLVLAALVATVTAGLLVLMGMAFLFFHIFAVKHALVFRAPHRVCWVHGAAGLNRQPVFPLWSLAYVWTRCVI